MPRYFSQVLHLSVYNAMPSCNRLVNKVDFQLKIPESHHWHSGRRALASTEPLEVEELCKNYEMVPRTKPAKIYDAFLFNDELDMLEVCFAPHTAASTDCAEDTQLHEISDSQHLVRQHVADISHDRTGLQHDHERSINLACECMQLRSPVPKRASNRQQQALPECCYSCHGAN